MRPLYVLSLAASALSFGCISSNPAAPAVRWFDPRPPRAAHDQRESVTVHAAPFLRQDFVVRIPPHEVAIDDSLRWIAPPEQIVEAALDSAPALPIGMRVDLVRFEFERADGIAAICELSCRIDGSTRPVVGRAVAASEQPEALAAAMAKALDQVAAAVVQLVQKRD